MKLTMVFKLDLKEMTLTVFRTPVQDGLMQKNQYILHRKWTLACILCTHQKSYKLDEGIMLIFVSEKNRPLLLAKGVHFVFLLERTVSFVIETWFQIYKATGSAIVVTCTFWRNCNSSHKKGPRSLALTMRVAMIYRTLVVAALQLSRRKVYDASIRGPSHVPPNRERSPNVPWRL